MSDPYKLRAAGLLIAAGFVGGLYLQYKVPGKFVPGERHKRVEHKQFEGVEDDEGEKAPPKPEVAEAVEAGSELSDAAAITALIDNTVQFRPLIGAPVSLYFSHRGLSGESRGDEVLVRGWSQAGNQLCLAVNARNDDCRTISIKLDAKLLDKNAGASEMQLRIDRLPTGAVIGKIKGLSFGTAVLMRGNVRLFPDYVPLVEPTPKQESLLIDRPGEASEAPGIVGALLLRARKDENRMVTFFAPWGHLLEVTREGDAVKVAHLWLGSWRRDGVLLCRDLHASDEQIAAARDNGLPRHSQECSPFQVEDERVVFSEAGPGRRTYFRQGWTPAPAPTVAVRSAPDKSATTLSGGAGKILELR